MKHIRVCKYCGTEDVVVDAYARWNPMKCKFELDAVFEYAYCNACDGETQLITKNEYNETK